ncbi:MAG TPA: hypothetical protein VL598_10190 [Trinickia sp.]|uniref:hypothetical protein n=1 Tax=Trinickia sp. TaxID=2571163 RepID=UPI002D0A70E0|nr:hypothetical protein [Trinickia sp.]HTI18022.1 hypothetical protein [Trinickia sp.]
MAFYEPLHEMLASIDPAMLASSTADSWRSGHPDLDAPYFDEFAELLEPGARGIPGYDVRFALDMFEQGVPAQSDQLAAYVNDLIDVAKQRGGVPVFKFCRSLGRLPWFRATFPDAVHIAVAKNPISQWQSCWNLFAKHRNAHFVADPFAVLTMTQHEPITRWVLDALQIELPALPPGTNETLEACLDFFKQYVQHTAPATCYRAFLAHWLLASRHAATHAHALFDCDLAAWSPAYVQAAERWMVELSGLAPSFSDVRSEGKSARDCGFDAQEGVQIHIQALNLARALVRDDCAHTDTLALWTNKLAQATQVLVFGAEANLPQEQTPPHRASRVVDVALVDGVGLEDVLIGELAATRAALAKANRRLADVDNSLVWRLTKRARQLLRRGSSHAM